MDSFVWRAICKSVLDDPSTKPEHREVFEKHAAAGSPAFVLKNINHAKMSATYKKRDQPVVMRIELGVQGEVHQVIDTLTTWLTERGATVCRGKAPRSHTERELSRVMDELRLWRPKPENENDEEADI